MLNSYFTFFAALFFNDYNLVSSIINGKNAKSGEFPYQVNFVKGKGRIHFCGGTLIAKRHVLTAAHCCHFLSENNPARVVFGSVKLNGAGGHSFVVKKCIVSPDYEPSLIGMSDVAIVVVKASIQLIRIIIK